MIKRIDWYFVGLLVVIGLAVFIEHDTYAVLGYFLGGVFFFIDQIAREEKIK